jgi:hypothetical protein
MKEGKNEKEECQKVETVRREVVIRKKGKKFGDEKGEIVWHQSEEEMRKL